MTLHSAEHINGRHATPLAAEDIDALLRRVDDAMLQATRSNVDPLGDASAHIIDAGGKRVRPRMMLLVYNALGGQTIEQAIAPAAALELMHTASVVHDDINDHGVVRRGRPSVNARWGRTFALLTGDFLFTKVYELMAPYGALNVTLAQAAVALVEGETLQASAVKNRHLTREVYMRIIGLKTAELFRAAAKMGAQLAAADADVADTLGEYGYNVGMAFQIVDDILDLTADADQTGKTSHLDVAQGKGIASVLDENNAASNALDAARARLSGPEAVARGRALAQHYGDRALDNLGVLADSPARNGLADVVATVLGRTH